MQAGVEKFKTVSLVRKDPKNPLRPGFGTLGTPIVVRANFFALKFPRGLIIYDYRVEFNPTTDIGRLKGRILDLLLASPQFTRFKAIVAHDRSERLIAARELPQPLSVDIRFVEEGETQASAKAKTYTVKVTKTGELNTDALHKHTDGDPAYVDKDIGSLISALNLVVQADASRKGARVGKNRHFFEPSVGSIGGGIEAWRGFYASVRPVWKSMMVNINVCMTAFVESKNMATAISDFQKGSRGAIPDLGKMFGKSVIRIKTLHLGYRKPVRGIMDKKPSQQTFPCAELGGTVTVAEYFRRKYPDHPIKYPDLPLLDIGSDKRPNYIPAEFCEIVKGQPFRGRLNDRQTSDMLRVACQNPQRNSELIRGEGFLNLGLSTPHDTMKSFGITIDQQMTVVPARVLPPPGISYAGGRPPRVNDGSWNILDVKFHRGGNMGRWAVLIVREKSRPGPWTGPNDPQMWEFINRFAQKCRTVGMVLSPERPAVVPTQELDPPGGRDPSRTAAVAEIKRVLTLLINANPRPSFVLVLLNNRDNYIYPGIKRIGDVELGIHTVCMQLDKASGRGDANKQDQYFSNVALKVNTKLGGINHKLDANSMRWLTEKRTMVVGADVTHPGPTSADGTPSLAAVVASIDNDFVHFPASMELQESKKEMIEKFTEMMVERLLLWQQRNKGLPERVLLFRDGVSEGQFDLVLENELPQIQEAFRQVYESSQNKGAKKPQLMICICGKRHHARFYPTDSANATKNGNTKPGTIVDKGVGDVYRFDFYLQAHAGLQGTVKATHYTVVYDEIGFTADMLQQGTHTSSYAYVRATKAVSLCPPAYYSDLACERGRLYLNDLFNLGAEKTGAIRGGKRDKDAAKKQVFDRCIAAWGTGIHPNVKNSMFYI